jgi:hypothetical protein
MSDRYSKYGDSKKFSLNTFTGWSTIGFIFLILCCVSTSCFLMRKTIYENIYSDDKKNIKE